MSDYQLRNQPSFCPLCGAEFSNLTTVRTHLHVCHRLSRRQQLVAFHVAWRETSIAFAGITEPGPGWSRP